MEVAKNFSSLMVHIIYIQVYSRSRCVACWEEMLPVHLELFQFR